MGTYFNRDYSKDSAVVTSYNLSDWEYESGEENGLGYIYLTKYIGDNPKVKAPTQEITNKSTFLITGVYNHSSSGWYELTSNVFTNIVKTVDLSNLGLFMHDNNWNDFYNRYDEGWGSYGWDLFKNCTNLTTVSNIGSVTDVWGMFDGCINLTSVTFLSENITYCDSCFNNTSIAKNVYIPFKYANGVNTKTYNTFNQYYGNGQNGVTLVNLSSL